MNDYSEDYTKPAQTLEMSQIIDRYIAALNGDLSLSEGEREACGKMITPLSDQGDFDSYSTDIFGFLIVRPSELSEGPRNEIYEEQRLKWEGAWEEFFPSGHNRFYTTYYITTRAARIRHKGRIKTTSRMALKNQKLKELRDQLNANMDDVE
jgi:hypothetical protein